MIRVHIALFFVSLLYAILFSWAGQIMPVHLTAEGFVFLRIAFATSLFHLIALFQQTEKINWKLHLKEFAICGFFGTSANMFLFFKGLVVHAFICCHFRSFQGAKMAELAIFLGIIHRRRCILFAHCW